MRIDRSKFIDGVLRASRTPYFVAIATIFSTLAPHTSNAAILPTIKTGVASLYTYDHAVAFLGLQFGIDPRYPLVPVSGTFNDGGFAWESQGLYQGASYDFRVVGSYDVVTDTVNWSGVGAYGGTPWNFSGASRWMTENSFETNYSISFNGKGSLYTSDATGNHASNDTNCADLTKNVVECREESRGWWARTFGVGPTSDRYVIITTLPGVVSVDTETLVDKGSETGAKVGLDPIRGASGEIVRRDNGYFYTKATVVTKVPEPDVWSVILIGFSSMFFVLRRNNR